MRTAPEITTKMISKILIVFFLVVSHRDSLYQ